MQFIKSVIILGVVICFASCGERSDDKSGLKDSKTSTEQEPVIGLWKSGKEYWSTMNFLENGIVELESSDGESSMANWKRFEGLVYKIRIENEIVGAYDLIKSSVTIPEPINGKHWRLKPNSVQYEIWSDSKSDSVRLGPVTVDGDWFQKDLGASSKNYRRIN